MKLFVQLSNVKTLLTHPVVQLLLFLMPGAVPPAVVNYGALICQEWRACVVHVPKNLVHKKQKHSVYQKVKSQKKCWAGKHKDQWVGASPNGTLQGDPRVVLPRGGLDLKNYVLTCNLGPWVQHKHCRIFVGCLQDHYVEQRGRTWPCVQLRPCEGSPSICFHHHPVLAKAETLLETSMLEGRKEVVGALYPELEAALNGRMMLDLELKLNGSCFV